MFEVIAYNDSGEKLTPTVSSALMDSIEKNKRYAIILENGIDLALILIEIYKKQAVSVPIMPSLNKKQVDNIVSHADVDGVISRQHSTIVLTPRQSTLTSPLEQRFIIYTSGSTGAPKGVVQNQQAIEHNAMQVAKIHNFSTNSCHATCLPLYHCNALMMSLIGCYLTQSPLIMLSAFSPDVYFKVIQQHNVTTASIVPALIPKLIESKPLWPKSLLYLITAAAPLTQRMAQLFFKLYGTKIRQGYGLSEAVNFSFVMPLLTSEKFIEHYIWNHPPVGLPVNGTEFKLSENSEVLVKGPNVMVGYWLNESETNKTIVNGWLKTGDLGYIRDEFLVLTGRKKEIINRGGETRLPLELEDIYQEYIPNDVRFIAVPTQHKTLDNEIGIMFDTSDLDNPININHMLEVLNHTIVPATFGFKGISKTSTGKPQRIKDGNSLFCYQGNSDEILKALVSLRVSSILPSASKLKVERSLQQIIPKKYVLGLDINNMNDLSGIIDQFITSAINFYDIPTPKKLDFSKNINFQSDTSKRVYYVTNTQVNEYEEYLNKLDIGDTIIFLQSSDVIDGIENPFNDVLPEWVTKTIPNNLDLQQYWLTVSPIKFKQFKFFNLIVIGKNE